MVENLVWYYLAAALAISAVIWLGCCVAMDYSTYVNLQRRLRLERERR
ncbi:MAG TPA: hypothetical protein VM050_08160 [Patescibacteria group bacterium]|nr:hypothetical protein [Patescibacteria group bacterium]